MKKGSKKVEAPPAPSGDPLDEVQQAFELFDSNGSGKRDAKEIREALQAVGFDNRNPSIYQVIAELDTPEAEKAGGITFDDFEAALNAKFADKDSKESLRKVFDLLVDDPNTGTITAASCARFFNELGKTETEEDFQRMLSKATKTGEVNFDEFCQIMTRTGPTF